jgi:signal transduction histidine kinase
MGTFELITKIEEAGLQAGSGQEQLGSTVLLKNARWFTQVRWIVVIVFIILGLLGIFLPGLFKNHGLVPPSKWPWILAGILVLVNIPLSYSVHRLKDSSPRQSVELNIWLQIIIDLLVVTGMVYSVGSTDTFISFTYLFHIALACIFFPPRSSLVVTFVAAVLYIALVSFQKTGIVPVAGILTSNQLIDQRNSSMIVFNAASAVFVWLVVWYFISTLSTAVRRRDQQLATANEQLIKADEEKTQQMLITTHELKAPFAGIETNIQLLKYQYWKDIPESIRSVIDHIDARAQTLRERIGKILILGDLKTKPTLEEQVEGVDLKKIMDIVVEDLVEKAEDRKVALDVQFPQIEVRGNVEKLGILFSNLVSNAINYSFEGGTVEVTARESGNEVTIAVSDHGIGIREDALPHIFDEYYRTKEASKFNKSSTGLGLSMVKEIARNLGLKVVVTSTQGEGTTFEVTAYRTAYNNKK